MLSIVYLELEFEEGWHFVVARCRPGFIFERFGTTSLVVWDGPSQPNFESILVQIHHAELRLRRVDLGIRCANR